MADYNIDFLIRGTIPDKFKNIVSNEIMFGKYQGETIGYVVDVNPFYLLQKKDIFNFDNEFVEYLKAVQRMRINFYCPFVQSWKEFYETQYPSSNPYLNGSYAQHELM